MAREFEEENGSIICRELLSRAPGTEASAVDSSFQPEERTEAYYRKRPCPELAASAAGILERYLGMEGAGGVQTGNKSL